MTLRPAAVLSFLAAFVLALASTAAVAHDHAAHGGDQVRIADGRPWQARARTIEVAEVFAYWCPHCAQFEPILAEWARTLPKDVRLVRVPAAFRLEDAYGRAFFAAEALSALPKTHDATFRAVHATQVLPGRSATIDEIAAFYGGLGVDPAKAAAAMRSPATDARMREAREFAVRSGVEGTPTLVVNGVWRVQGETLRDTLRIAETLIARERAAATPR